MIQSGHEVPQVITTVMLRNIPTRYSVEELLAELFFYLIRKRVVVSAAVREGVRANVEDYVLEHGHIGNPWFRPLILDWGKYKEEH